MGTYRRVDNEKYIYVRVTVYRVYGEGDVELKERTA